MPDIDQVLEWRGSDVVDRDGDKVGKLEEIYLDQDTDRPEWAAVKTGLLGSKLHFAPLIDAVYENGKVRLPFEKSQINSAPNAEADGQLSQDEEAQLYRHYGYEYGESRSDSGLPQGGTGQTTQQPAQTQAAPQPSRGTVGRDTSGPVTDDAMTRSEEQLRVGVTQRETGRVRLRKYIVEEPVQTTVNVAREEVRIEREPITDANRGQAYDGPALSEEEHEVTLTEQQAVVEKEVVPVERVRLDKETVVEQQTVSDTVRKEQIEVEGGEGLRGGTTRPGGTDRI